jgi:predicted RecB family endonuclease
VEFDFDQWCRLARDDPEQFERRRAAAIAQLIARATPQRQTQLWNLQARIDRERRAADTPLAAAGRLQQMLADQLAQLSEAFERLGERSRKPAPETREEQGRVLRFTRRD